MNDYRHADFADKINKFAKKYDVEKFNDDTPCAIVNIRENKALIKSKIRTTDTYIKHRHAINLLTEVYPNADTNVVSMELIKIGVFPPKLTRRISWIITFLVMVSILYTTIWTGGMNTEDKVGITILISIIYYFAHWVILVTGDYYKVV